VSESSVRPPRLPPRWFIRSFWAIHRALYRVSRGRLGLSAPKPGGWGTLRLTTTGRHSGTPRSVMLGYFVDGTRFVTLAMNGWGAAEPAWWLNLQADPTATIDVGEVHGPVRAEAATGAERERLWALWATIEPQLDAYAERRPGPTAVIVLTPTAGSGLSA
jgi:deazaflavin-dependent oxidoreductase (nitroreductase family)